MERIVNLSDTQRSGNLEAIAQFQGTNTGTQARYFTTNETIYISSNMRIVCGKAWKFAVLKIHRKNFAL